MEGDLGGNDGGTDGDQRTEVLLPRRTRLVVVLVVLQFPKTVQSLFRNPALPACLAGPAPPLWAEALIWFRAVPSPLSERPCSEAALAARNSFEGQLKFALGIRLGALAMVTLGIGHLDVHFLSLVVVEESVVCFLTKYSGRSYGPCLSGGMVFEGTDPGEDCPNDSSHSLRCCSASDSFTSIVTLIAALGETWVFRVLMPASRFHLQLLLFWCSQ